MSNTSPLVNDAHSLLTHAASICYSEPFTDSLHDNEYTEPEWQAIDYLDEHDFNLVETLPSHLVFSVPDEYVEAGDTLVVQFRRWSDSSHATETIEYSESEMRQTVMAHGSEWVVVGADEAPVLLTVENQG